MAYYISFLKCLSLKLNKHTVHFFYNEVSNLLKLRRSLDCLCPSGSLPSPNSGLEIHFFGGSKLLLPSSRPGGKTNFVVEKLYVSFYAAVVFGCVDDRITVEPLLYDNPQNHIGVSYKRDGRS